MNFVKQSYRPYRRPGDESWREYEDSGAGGVFTGAIGGGVLGTAAGRAYGDYRMYNNAHRRLTKQYGRQPTWNQNAPFRSSTQKGITGNPAGRTTSFSSTPYRQPNTPGVTGRTTGGRGRSVSAARQYLDRPRGTRSSGFRNPFKSTPETNWRGQMDLPRDKHLESVNRRMSGRTGGGGSASAARSSGVRNIRPATPGTPSRNPANSFTQNTSIRSTPNATKSPAARASAKLAPKTYASGNIMDDVTRTSRSYLNTGERAARSYGSRGKTLLKGLRKKNMLRGGLAGAALGAGSMILENFM